MEIVSPVEVPAALAKSLKKFRYEVHELNGNLVFESKHTKPAIWFMYFLFGVGIIRIIAQRFIQGMISIALGIGWLIVTHYEKRKYDMTYTEIQIVAVSEEGIAFSYKDKRQKTQLQRENIQSLTSEIGYDGNFTLAYVILQDNSNISHTLFILMSKSESLVKQVSEEVITAIKSKLSIA